MCVCVCIYIMYEALLEVNNKKTKKINGQIISTNISEKNMPKMFSVISIRKRQVKNHIINIMPHTLLEQGK